MEKCPYCGSNVLKSNLKKHISKCPYIKKNNIKIEEAEEYIHRRKLEQKIQLERQEKYKIEVEENRRIENERKKEKKEKIKNLIQEQGDNGMISNLLIKIINLIISTVSLLIWSIIGLLIWIPLITRISAWFSFLTILATIKPINLSSQRLHLNFAATFYTKGFTRIIKSVFARTDETKNEDTSSCLDTEISLSILFKESLIAIIFWVIIFSFFFK